MKKHFRRFKPEPAERETAFMVAGNRVVPLWHMRGDRVGSAVAVKIGKRAFLFTAAHLVSDGEPVQALQPPGTGPIIDFHLRACDDSGSDLAFLELSPVSAAKLPYFVEESEIVADFDVEFAWPVVVAGCSQSEYVRVTHSTLGAITSVTGGRLKPLAHWPSAWPHSDYGPPKASGDVLVPYPKETQRKFVIYDKPAEGGKLQKTESPSPKGLSGGGIWIELHHEPKPRGLR